MYIFYVKQEHVIALLHQSLDRFIKQLILPLYASDRIGHTSLSIKKDTARVEVG